jgi:hypothetical protein
MVKDADAMTMPYDERKRAEEPKDAGSKAQCPDNATLCQQGLMPKR